MTVTPEEQARAAEIRKQIAELEHQLLELHVKGFIRKLARR